MYLEFKEIVVSANNYPGTFDLPEDVQNKLKEGWEIINILISRDYNDASEYNKDGTYRRVLKAGDFLTHFFLGRKEVAKTLFG